MPHYPVHTIATAPEASRPSLKALQSAFGFIPNMAGAMATSPVLTGSLVGLFAKVHGGSFTEPQIQVLLLTNAVTNASEWAAAFPQCAGSGPRHRSGRRERHSVGCSAARAQARRALQAGQDPDRDPGQGRPSRKGSVSGGGFHARTAAGSYRGQCRLDDDELHRERDAAASGSAVRRACMARRLTRVMAGAGPEKGR